MPTNTQRAYQVGEFWLARDKENGPWKINWYDRRTGQTRRKTTGEKDFQRAIAVITEHHLANLDTAAPEQDGFTVRQVALKYWLEHGQHLTASGTCRISMNKLNGFLEHIEAGGPSLLADNWTKQTTKDLIVWMKANPSMQTKHDRDAKGNITRTYEVPRPQTDKTINRHIDDVRAAFRYCMDRPPIIQGIAGTQAREGRKKPTLSKDQVRALFAYAFASSERRHLQNYLLLAFTTLARPEAILDISVAPERQQIEWDVRLLHLNPQGRTQTKKYRPIVPINEYLLPVIQSGLDLYESAKENPEVKTSGFLVEYKGKPMACIRMTWNRAKKALGWPSGGAIGRDWDAKMIRHTMAKHLRRAGAPWTEIEGQMGHNINSQSSTYAEYEPDYLGHAQAEISRYLADIFDCDELRNVPLTSHLKSNVVSMPKKKAVNSMG